MPAKPIITPAAPTEVAFKPPAEDYVSSGYHDFIGIRAQNQCSQFLVSDGANKSIIAQTTGNIYLDAVENTQFVTKTHFHRATALVTEVYKSVLHIVEENEDNVIHGNHNFHANGDQYTSIVGNHTLNVGKKQMIVAGEGQEIAVKSGGRTLEVLGDGNNFITVTGAEERKITKSHKLEVVEECDWFKWGNSFNVFLGAEESFKGSNSLGINVGAKEEGNLAIAEVCNVGGFMEQTFAVKRQTNMGLNMENNQALVIKKTTTAEKNEITVAGKYKSALNNRDFKASFEKSKFKKIKTALCMWG